MTVVRLLVVAILTVGFSSLAGAQVTTATEVAAMFRAYDQAYNAKDLTRLGSFYHPDVTVFEGGSIDRGWIAYRDHHLSKELRSFQSLKWGHTNIQVQALSPTAAYVTADYSISYVINGLPAKSVGLATHVVTKDNGTWRIRHTHSSTRR